MSDAVKVGFVPFSAAARGILVVFCDDALKFGAATRKALGSGGRSGRTGGGGQPASRARAAPRSIFWRPQGLKASRLIVVGAGKLSAIKDNDFLKLGGVIAGKLRAGSEAVTIIADLPDGADEAGAGRRDRLGRAAARLQIRSLQDQKEGRRGRRIARRRFGRGRRCRRRAKSLRARRPHRRRRDPRARTRQRAAERALSRRVRASRQPVAQARRRGRGARRQGDDQARHGRAARRRPGLDAARPHRDHALERRQARRRSRWRSSARASASIPAASRSRAPPAWRT